LPKISLLKLRKNIVIITGGSGFGKTEIIEELKRQRRHTCPEFARDIIFSQSKINSDILPWKNLKLFQKEITERRLGFYRSVGEKSDFVFSDRGLPDQIAFARYHGKTPTPELIDLVNKCPYYKIVFITPPWKEIYVNDSIRKETFEESCIIHKYVLEVYLELGYSILDIPFGNSLERAEFILDNI